MTFIKNYLYALATMLGLLLAISITTSYLWNTIYSSQSLFYADDGNPIISNVDGFFFMGKAKEYLEQGVNAPALAWFTANIHKITGFSITNIAFWLPPVLALMLFPCYYVWGRLLSFTPLLSFAAAFLGSLMPAWIERSRVGWFDTDTGIALFWNLCLLSSAFLILPSCKTEITLKGKVIACISFLSSWLLLAWWWKPGAILLFLCLGLWGISFAWANTVIEKYVRQISLLCLIIGACVFIFLPQVMPISLVNLRAYALDHAHLVLGLKDDIIANSILELKSLNIEDTLIDIFGNWLGGSLAIIATICFAIRYPWAMLVLLPSMLMLILGLFSKRFLYFAALPMGLALAMFWQNITFWLRITNKKVVNIGLVVHLLIISACFGQWLLQWQPIIYFKREHDVIAQKLNNVSTNGAAVWNWWDDGYFLYDRARLKPLFDGGSQNQFIAHIAAFPFMNENTLFARRWIRFFSLRGIYALEPLTAHYHSEKKAKETLISIFMQENPDTLLHELPPNLRQWIFPTGEVYLYFSQRILNLSHWWGPIGLKDEPQKQDLIPYLDIYKKENFYHDAKNAILILPQKALDKGFTGVNGVYGLQFTPLAPPFPKNKGVFAIVPPESDWLYFATTDGLSSLPLRLMAGEKIAGFNELYIDYAYGGAWEVLP